MKQSGKARSVVQRGLEVIRALGNHGMHVRLLIFLAFNFGDKVCFVTLMIINLLLVTVRSALFSKKHQIF